MKLRKILSLLLTAAMIFTLSISVFAESGTQDSTKGSIMIKNPVSDQTYDIYRLLVLESFDTEKAAYIYSVDSDWSAFFAGSDVKDVYVNIDENGYVTWIENASAADFAKLALAYAKGNTSITPDGTLNSEKTTATELPLGYYLVDSSLGALCALTTTAPDAEISEKNDSPSIDKQVKEDSDNEWHEGNDADIGQTVEFKTTIHAKKGAENYVMHDVMCEGLTLVAGSVVVENLKADDYRVITDCDDKTCTFEVVFTPEYLNTIAADTDLVVTYSAVLNEKAVIAGDGNPNKTQLTYGDQSSTEWDETRTYTWKLDLFKYTNGTQNAKVPLDGAVFSLYSDKDCNNVIKFAEVDGENTPTYRVDAEGTVIQFTTPQDGVIVIQGLDADNYFLKEIDAPQGYNKLADAVAVVIEHTGAENTDLYTMTNTVKQDNVVVEQVEILNQTGAVLPTTGGNGTTMLLSIGAILFAAAGILLVAKKRAYNAI